MNPRLPPFLVGVAYQAPLFPSLWVILIALARTASAQRVDIAKLPASSTLDAGSWVDIATHPGTVSLTVPVTVTAPEPIISQRFLRLRVTR